MPIERDICLLLAKSVHNVAWNYLNSLSPLRLNFSFVLIHKLDKLEDKLREILFEHLIAFISDGAPIMLGAINGLIVSFEKEIAQNRPASAREKTLIVTEFGYSRK